MKPFLAMLAAGLLASPVLAQQATQQSAQAYPNRPLRMVIPWPPGQATDLVGRVVAQRLSDVLGQQVIADNRPGAGGAIGTDIVAKAAPDGYTLLHVTGSLVINPRIYRKLPYDVFRDLEIGRAHV